MNNVHPMTQTDFYKVNHKFQYPEGTSLVFSGMAPRSGKHFPIPVGGVVFTGLQKLCMEHLIEDWEDNFFNVDIGNAYGFYRRRIETSLGPDAIDFSHVEELHDLGYLPIRIRALPEGVIVPFKVPMFTIENTLPEFFWLTNYLETVISSEIWKPTTVATIAREYRKILEEFAEATGAPKEMIPLSVHDFSMRGMSGRADAANSGVGHLLSFVGSDNIPAIDTCERYYFADSENELIGTSIPASEHSVMCAGGKEDEFDTYKRFITDLYPNGLVGIVSDTWDLWKVLTEIAPALKDEIMARDGKVVFRPDSGDPANILCGTVNVPVYNTLAQAIEWEMEAIHEESGDNCGQGYLCDDKAEAIVSVDGAILKLEFYVEVGSMKMDVGDRMYWVEKVCHTETVDHELTNAEKGAVQILWEQFGGTTNDKGFKELDSHVGLIYGDSITLERCREICERLKQKGFSSGNVVFGVGSYTYQMITRDTFGMAMKATYCEVDGEGRNIFKDPITDDGVKKSAKGLQMVVKDPERPTYALIDEVTWKDVNSDFNELRVVFEDGKMVRTQTLAEIRALVESSF